MKRALKIAALVFVALLVTFMTVRTVTALGNQSPVAEDDAYGTVENTPLVVNPPGVTVNDYDPDGDPITVSLDAAPEHGDLSLQSNGGFIYTPFTNFNGVDTFVYRLTDAIGDWDTATVTITVTSVNQGPYVAHDDAYEMDEDGTLTVPAPGVLANDVDADHPYPDPATVVLVDNVQHGTLTLNADGSFTYTPDADWYGEVSFTYYVDDGSISNSNTATVTITVNSVNDAPVAVDDAYDVDEDNTLTVDAPGVLENDSDVEGDALTAELVEDAANGSVTLNEDGSFSYTPDEDYNGEDSFTYRAFDGEAYSEPATVTITVNPVNDAPVAVDDAYDVDEDNTLTVDAPGVLENDSDVEGDALTAELVEDAANGSVTLNADGSFTYTPDPDYNGTDTFTYRAFDGELYSEPATVTIIVNPVNDAPVAAGEDYEIDEDEELHVSEPGLLANDTDVDGDELSVVLVDDVQNGTLDLNADGSFTYTPDQDWFGVDSFTYYVTDGELDSETVTVTITVNAVNDAPTAADVTFEDDPQGIDEDTYLLVLQPGLLLYCDDVDTPWAELTVELVNGPSHAEEFYFYANGAFYYKPIADFNGEDSFTYRAFDGELYSEPATVTIVVFPVNDDPVANDDTALTRVDEIAENIDVLANDTDIDGDDLLVSAITVDPQNGTAEITAGGMFISYTPNPGFAGVDTFEYEVSDGNGGTATATVTVRVNTPPVANDDTFSSGAARFESTDIPQALPDLATVTSTVEVSGIHSPIVKVTADLYITHTFIGDLRVSLIAPDGTEVILTNQRGSSSDYYGTGSAPELRTRFDDDAAVGIASGSTPFVGVYRPEEPLSAFAGKSGDDVNGVWTLKIVDVWAADSGTLHNWSVTIEYGCIEDYLFAIPGPGVLANDTDADGDELMAVLVDGPANGIVLLGQDGGFIYIPDADFHGEDSFTYCVYDGYHYSEDATVTIIVAPVNDAPVAVDDTAETDEDHAVDIFVLDNDYDVDEDALIIIEVTQGANGTVAISPCGTYVIYTPNQDYFGEDSFTYTISDGELTATATVYVTVISVNDAPVVELIVPLDGAMYLEGTNVTLHATASDVDGTVVLVEFYADGSLIGSDATSPYDLTWNNVTRGQYELQARAIDNDGAETWSNTVTITVDNTPPTVAITEPADGTTYLVGSNVTVRATATDSDGVQKVIFYLNGNLLGQDNTSPYAVSWNNMPAGTHTLTAKAWDTEGLWAESAPVTVIVRPEITAVTLTADPPSPKVTGTTVTLTAEANGGVMPLYRFLVHNGVAWTTLQSYSAQNTCTWTPTVAGNYTLMVYAKDQGWPDPASANFESFRQAHRTLSYTVISDITGVTLSTDLSSPRSAETSITLTATAEGGTTPQYRFLTYTAATGWVTIQPYGAANTCVWTPDTPGTYTLMVYVREVGFPGSYQAYKTMRFTIAPKITAVSLTPSVASPRAADTPITLTAAATGGARPLYRFLVHNGTSWTTIRSYATQATCTWTPSAPGNYTLMVYAKDEGWPDAERMNFQSFYQAFTTISYTIVPKITAVTLSADPASPQAANTPITLTAEANGGAAPQYRFLVHTAATGWVTIQAYSAANTCVWTPTTPGTYTVMVYAREQGVTASYQAFKTMAYTVQAGAE